MPANSSATAGSRPEAAPTFLMRYGNPDNVDRTRRRLDMLSIADMLRLSKERTSLLHSEQQPDAVIEVHEHQRWRWLYTGGTAIQSVLNLDDPTELSLANHKTMLTALLLCDTPRRALSLGFGTGSFERFFRARRPTLEMVSVDASQTMVDVARDYFQIPADWPVVIQSAEQYLRENRQAYDVIFCDLFAGDRAADCLYDADFYASAARCLTSAGAIAMNLSPSSEAELLEILLAIRASFPWVLLAKIPDHGNIVLLLSRQAPPSDEVLRQRAADSSRLRHVDLSAVLSQLVRLPAPDGDIGIDS